MSNVISPQLQKNSRILWVVIGVAIGLVCCCSVICLVAFAFGVGVIANTATEVTPTESVSPSVIKITLTNQNCHPNDFYVDDQLIISSIQPGADVVFSTTTGNHVVFACAVGTNICAEKTSVFWSSSTTTFFLEPAADCQNST